ncbi:MAG: 4-(cytidine 5'-diphospho)-2-C-methyl-D-erythritol kinase [Thermodesulfobacteriota bacterium]|nr:4-(cytidine 5'-diphospho)-2-C-methyl-D-erythritol kinase [Thermodesulfobacteriota bacterium]
MKELTVQAPAKVNFFLAVKSKRPDGYHEIETWMQKLEMADTIKLQVSEAGISLCCPGSDLPVNSDNLAWQAAALFLEETKIKNGIEIELIKKIPVAAGLGGGSSDGAAVLKGMNTLFSAGLPQQKLMEMAYSLGADVPFFIADPSAAWATGIGEKLAEAELRDQCWLVLVNPGFSVSTKWVYQNFALTTEDNPDILDRLLLYRNLCQNLFNDLESVTLKKYPEVATIKKKFLNCGADAVLMSGSGPTVFGIFQDEKTAQECVTYFRPYFDKNVFLTRPAISL